MKDTATSQAVTSPLMGKLTFFDMKRHTTLESIVAALYELPHLDGVETLPALHGSPEMPLQVYLGLRRPLGFYGYADTDTMTLHFWVDCEKARFGPLVGFFAHELAHFQLHPPGPVSEEDRERFEREADLYATIARQALAMARGLLRVDPATDPIVE